DQRIDEETDGKLGDLTWPQLLIGEAEALQLIEVRARLLRKHVEARDPSEGPVADVDRAEERQRILAELDLKRALHGLEAPGETRLDIGIEAHRHRLGQDARRGR